MARYGNFHVPYHIFRCRVHGNFHVPCHIFRCKIHENSMYLAISFVARYTVPSIMEISMYPAIYFVARYMKISMYPVISFVARYTVPSIMEISMYLAMCLFRCMIHGNFQVPCQMFACEVNCLRDTRKFSCSLQVLHFTCFNFERNHAL